MRMLIALGGNAMTAPDGSARPEDQRTAVIEAMTAVAALVEAGHSVVLTHGNGPQVGNLLVKNELAASVVPPVPLDWCGAQTQGTIGALMLDALDAEFARRGLDRSAAAVVSRTLVDPTDEHFAVPSKPIGRYVDRDAAAVMIEHGQTWQDRGTRGWRRVVASPEPLECLDAPAARTLLDAGYVVVCAGGGGIPVVRDPDGTVRGVEAVIDKDLTAAVLAVALELDLLVIATDVDAVAVAYGTPQQSDLGHVSVRELRSHAADGEFADGSMGPKVEAACRFAERGGRAVITSLHRIADAIAGAAGTSITKE